jgi:hypothetical protein
MNVNESREIGLERTRVIFREWEYGLRCVIETEPITSDLDEQTVRVFDGSWDLMPFVYWLRNRPGDTPRQQWEEPNGWYFYCVASFAKSAESNWHAFSEVSSKDFEIASFVHGIQEVVLGSHYRQIFDAPRELSIEHRQAVAQEISNLEIRFPKLPGWLGSTPVTVIGDVPSLWRENCGEDIIYPLTEEFALKIHIQCSLHYRAATEEEIEILEEQLK